MKSNHIFLSSPPIKLSEDVFILTIQPYYFAEPFDDSLFISVKIKSFRVDISFLSFTGKFSCLEIHANGKSYFPYERTFQSLNPILYTGNLSELIFIISENIDGFVFDDDTKTFKFT